MTLAIVDWNEFIVWAVKLMGWSILGKIDLHASVSMAMMYEISRPMAVPSQRLRPRPNEDPADPLDAGTEAESWAGGAGASPFA